MAEAMLTRPIIGLVMFIAIEPFSALAAMPPVATPYRDADAYAVLSTWIRHYFRHDTTRNAVLIQQEIGAEALQRELGADMRFVRIERPNEVPVSCFPSQIRTGFADAFQDYSRQNSQNWLLEPVFSVKREKISLVPAAGLLPGWGKGGPDTPGETRERVYIVLSAVGFGSNRTSAVLFAAYHYRLGGGYDFFLLRKTGAVWHVVKTPSCGMIAE